MLLSLLGLYYLELARLLKSETVSVGGYTAKDLPHLEQETKKILNEAVSLGSDEVTTLLFQGEMIFA